MRNHSKREFLAGALAVLVPGAARAEADGAIVVPISYDTFFPLIPIPTLPVTLDGKGPYAFSFTTSSDFFIVDADLAQDLGLKPVNGVVNFLMGNRTVSMDKTEKEQDVACGSVKVGAFDLGPRHFVLGKIDPKDEVRHRNHLNAPVCDRGTLGTRMFLETPSRIDFDAGEVRFYPNGSLALDGFTDLDTHVDTSTAGGKLIAVAAHLDGEDLRCTVDLIGHAELYLASKYVKKHGLYEKYPDYIEQALDPSDPSKGTARVVRMRNFRLGGVTFDEINATLGDPKVDDHLGQIDVKAAIGGGLSRQLNLAFLDNRIFVRPNTHFVAVSPPYKVITKDDIPQ